MIKTDLVIYDSETRVIFGIITNATTDDNSQAIMNPKMMAELVDNTKDYIIEDKENHIFRYKKPNSKVLYLDDYRDRG